VCHYVTSVRLKWTFLKVCGDLLSLQRSRATRMADHHVCSVSRVWGRMKRSGGAKNGGTREGGLKWKNISVSCSGWEYSAKAPSVTISIDDSDSQIPFSGPTFCPGPDFLRDSHRISKPHGVTLMVAIAAMK